MTVQDKPGRGGSRMLMWFGHYSAHGLWAAIVAVVILGAFGEPHGLLKWIGAIPWLTWVTVALIAIPHHERRLCERCIARTPLDPQAAVSRWRPVLRWSHSRWQIAPSAGLAALAIGTQWVHGQPLWVYLVSSALLIAVGVQFLATWQHNRLQPWCPWCHWGDGGEEVSPDVPDPAMSR